MQKMLVLAFTLAVLSLSNAARAEPTPAERAACQEDAFKYCNHAIPSRDRVRTCLRENLRRISATCRGALQRTTRPS
jgi:hypothetical protein